MKIKKALLAITLALALSACVPVEEKHFDVKLLHGEWLEGTVHDTYLEGGKGYSWDTSDDITEEDASPFEWRLSYDTLQVNHALWNGAVVPKVYIVTTLDSLQLDYYEFNTGLEHHYTKVSNP